MTSAPLPAKLTTVTSPHSGPTTASSTVITPYCPFGPTGTSFSQLHCASRIPIPFSAVTNTPPEPSVPKPEPNGSLMVFTDYAPRSESPLHKTLSVDYAVVISGRICLELEGGEEVTMGPGEVLVQAGAMHKWKNETDEWTRVLFVMLGAHSDEKED